MSSLNFAYVYDLNSHKRLSLEESKGKVVAIFLTHSDASQYPPTGKSYIGTIHIKDGVPLMFCPEGRFEITYDYHNVNPKCNAKSKMFFSFASDEKGGIYKNLAQVREALPTKKLHIIGLGFPCSSQVISFDLESMDKDDIMTSTDGTTYQIAGGAVLIPRLP